MFGKRQIPCAGISLARIGFFNFQGPCAANKDCAAHPHDRRLRYGVPVEKALLDGSVVERMSEIKTYGKLASGAELSAVLAPNYSQQL